MNKQTGWVIWLTGLPASGKTTVAKEVREQLTTQEIDSILLDSDELRKVLMPRPSYTPEERDFFYSEVVGLAELLSHQGINILIAATGNKRRYRDAARNQLVHFMEVWVQCPVEVCQMRDPKGLYADAGSYRNHHLPGVGADYEPPDNADVTVNTQGQTPAESAHQIIRECGLLHYNRMLSKH